MKHKLALLLGLLLLVFAAACGAASNPAHTTAESLPAQPLPPPNYGGKDNQAGPGPTGVVPAPAQSPATTTDGLPALATNQMIIRTANVSLTVKDATAALETIKSTAAALGGYVANSQLMRINQDQVRVTLTVRVAADKFDEALKQIKAAGIRVNSEQTGSQDVGEEYTDLSARLRNLEATETELLALMTTVREKTSRAEDILAVQRELNTVRGQIEQIKGRMQYLDRQVALATLTVDLVPDTLEAPVASDVWDPLRVARDATRSLVVAMQNIIDAAIYLVIFLLPVALLLGLPLWLLLRWLRHARRPHPAATS